MGFSIWNLKYEGSNKWALAFELQKVGIKTCNVIPQFFVDD